MTPTDPATEEREDLVAHLGDDVANGSSCEAPGLPRQYARSSLVGFANDLGLLLEEYHVGADRQAGNTPQALLHLALVRASDALDHVRRASIRR